MPTHKSAEKRVRKSEKQRDQNRATRTAIRNLIKKVRTSATKADAEKSVPSLFSLMDKAARKHSAGFNQNRAGNYKRKVHSVLANLPA